ncbi:MAG: hypothetical protein J2P54_10430 [Bradyrhizobiaceae bacterium]|nr:hypothetical protein [Bradyrhizobiaceae bacterium]
MDTYKVDEACADKNKCEARKPAASIRFLALIGMLLLSGCMTDQGEYMRANGRTNPDRLQLALAQCQGEASATPQGFWVEGFGVAGLAGNLMLRGAQVDSVTSACMARHGYVVAQPKRQPQ